MSGVAAPPVAGSVQMRPKASIAMVSPSGDSATAMFVPSVIVTSITALSELSGSGAQPKAKARTNVSGTARSEALGIMDLLFLKRARYKPGC